MALRTPGLEKNKSYDEDNIFPDLFQPKHPDPSEIVELIQSNPVDITVGTGPNAKIYKVPKDLLTSRSMYFKFGFAGEFRESQENKVEFSSIDSDLFNRFLQWLYTGACKLDGVTDAIQAWSLGDYLRAPGFRNCAMECLYWHIRPNNFFRDKPNLVDSAMVAEAYQFSPPYSKLRMFFALCVFAQYSDPHQVKKGKWDQGLGDRAGDFLEDLLTITAQNKGRSELLTEIWANPKFSFELGNVLDG